MKVLKIEMDGKTYIAFLDCKHKVMDMALHHTVVLSKTLPTYAKYIVIKVFCILTNLQAC